MVAVNESTYLLYPLNLTSILLRLFSSQPFRQKPVPFPNPAYLLPFRNQ